MAGSHCAWDAINGLTVFNRAIVQRGVVISVTLFATFRRQRGCSAVLCAIVLAWVGIVATPCAMALSGDSTVVDSTPNVEVHTGCPNAALQSPMAERGCCCAQDVALKTGEQQLQKVDTHPAQSGGFDLLRRSIVVLASNYPRTSASNGRSLPIYLSTQRLRL